MQDTFVPENIHLPSIYVQRVVKGERYDKVIEVQVHIHIWHHAPCLSDAICMQRRTTRARGQESTRIVPHTDREKQRDRIVRRAALEFHDGMYGMCVNNPRKNGKGKLMHTHTQTPTSELPGQFSWPGSHTHRPDDK